MKKRRIVLTLTALLLACALAQDTTATHIETRLSIVESRLGRLEADVSRLSEVPTSLARIEEKLTALSERSSGNSNVLQTVGIGLVMSVLTGLVSFAMGKKSQK